MADPYQIERLQPSLLDRLTDDHAKARRSKPQNKNDSERITRESADRFIIDSRKLRELVKRDLSWLLNTGCLEDLTDLSDYPNIADSVLNYGVKDLTGSSVANANTGELEKQLRKSILNFEPRILKSSLHVKISKKDKMSTGAIIFEIECDVWGQPVPEHLYLQSELDVQTGNIKFADRLG